MFLFLLEEKKFRSALALSVMMKVDCFRKNSCIDAIPKHTRECSVSISGFHLRINFWLTTNFQWG